MIENQKETPQNKTQIPLIGLESSQVKLILSTQIQNSPLPPSASKVVELLLVLNLLIQRIHHK